ncbi:MAG: rhodanese-like domain-containing protein [Bacteroidota bacterium]|nr:rhodanese-like domain-containing protein [Bacteroidota bacterium]
MKRRSLIHLLIFSLIMVGCQHSQGQKPENWTADQLIEPSALAQTLQANKELPVIISVGPGAIIPHSIDIGMTENEKNLEKFKEVLSKLPKSTNIVVYCGCCPFAHCPNVRPAIDVLQKLKFTNYHLLNLPNNIKADWISKGYPQVK